MILNGSILTYVGKWPPIAAFFTLTSRAEYVARVSSALGKFGLAVRDARYDPPSAIFEQGGFFVTLQIQVQNKTGFGSEEDVIAIVRGEVYNVAGAFPASDSIPFNQPPGGTQQPTGQPVPQPTGPKTCAGALNSAGKWDFGCWLENLSYQGMFVVGLAGIAAVTLLVVATSRGGAPIVVKT